MKLKFKIFKQTPGYCGPACARMVLNYYGIKKSEEELAQAIGATREDGCNPWEIADGMEKIGLKSYYKKNSNLDEIKELLKKDIPVIIDWNPSGYGHYSVVVGIEKGSIYLADPKKDDIVSMSEKDFIERWFEYYDDKKVFGEIVVIENRQL